MRQKLPAAAGSALPFPFPACPVPSPYSTVPPDRTDKRRSEGMGIQSVRHIAEKNGGYSRFLYEDGVFCANVILRGGVQYNLNFTHRKVGRADGGNEFSNTL